MKHKYLSLFALAFSTLFSIASTETPAHNLTGDSHQQCIDEVVEYLTHRQNLRHKYSLLGTGRATRLLNQADYHAAISSFKGKWEQRGCRLLLNVAPTTLRIHGLNPATMILIPNTRCPLLHELLDDVAKRVGIKKPLLYVSDDPLFVNAAAGMISPSVGFVVIGSSALVNFSRRELVGTLAHELGHIRCNHGPKAFGLGLAIYLLTGAGRYVLYQQVSKRYGWRTAELVNLPAIGASLALTFWTLGRYLQHNEFEADRIEKKATNDPEALASSLQVLDEVAMATYSEIPIVEKQLLIENGITPEKECGTVISDSRRGLIHYLSLPIRTLQLYLTMHPSDEERETQVFS